MKTLNIQQGSAEWLAVRGKYRSASLAPAVMGVGKVKRSELVRMKATGDEQEFSRWVVEVLFERGHEIEALARPFAEEFIGEDLYPVTGVCPEDYLLASFDGLALLEDPCWECKSLNAEKLACVLDGRVPEGDYWQVVQQLAVSGAERALYTLSDGTPENTHHVWLSREQVGDDFEKLYRSWRQFDADVAAYVPVESAPEVVGRSPDDLPALRVEVTGMVTASNLDAFKDHALAVFSGINRELSTDADFADAEKTVKWCKGVESKLETAKEQALAQTADIDALFRTIDTVKEEARVVRLELEKLVKARKQAIRDDLLQRGRSELAGYIKNLNSLNRPLVDAGVSVPPVHVDFGEAMKGKRTIDSLRDAVDTALAGAKVELSRSCDLILENLALFAEYRADYAHLFSRGDLQALVVKPSSDFVAQVKLRIAEFEEAQAVKAAAETERRRRESEAAEAAASTPPPAPQAPQAAPAPRAAKAAVQAHPRPAYSDMVAVVAHHYGVSLDVADRWFAELVQERAA